jgi:hypothetical protein
MVTIPTSRRSTAVESLSWLGVLRATRQSNVYEDRVNEGCVRARGGGDGGEGSAESETRWSCQGGMFLVSCFAGPRGQKQTEQASDWVCWCSGCSESGEGMSKEKLLCR